MTGKYDELVLLYLFRARFMCIHT